MLEKTSGMADEYIYKNVSLAVEIAINNFKPHVISYYHTWLNLKTVNFKIYSDIRDVYVWRKKANSNGQIFSINSYILISDVWSRNQS